MTDDAGVAVVAPPAVVARAPLRAEAKSAAPVAEALMAVAAVAVVAVADAETPIPPVISRIRARVLDRPEAESTLTSCASVPADPALSR